MADELQQLLTALQAALVPPTTAAASLPAASDLAFERTLSRKLARSLDTEAHRVLDLASRVLDWAAPSSSSTPLDSDLVREGVYSDPTQRIERLLEHADDAIEKHLGIGKNRKGGPTAVGAKSAQEMNDREREKARRERLPARLLHDSTIDKPQLRFSARTQLPRPGVDDELATGDEGIPLWKPLLRRKINALGGEGGADGAEGWLQTELHEPTSSYTVTTATTPPAYTRYRHPYAAELAALKPPAHFLAPPQKPAPHAQDSFERMPFEWVDSADKLERMVEEIRAVGEEGAKDLAIDLEHHDFRTWGGLTCLIQLSTRRKDYVIDALEPSVRDGLEALNEFFTDPEWIKVLHGANSDIVWLQRDFGLYIVGLFDTYHATKVLGYSQHSLASLLDMYTDFEPDKRYQLADWRIRPLPKEMLHYARSDTHYLLSIYDHLRLALHAKASSSPSSTDPTPLEDVFARSTPVSGITFSLAPFDHATGHGDAGFLLPLAKHGQLKAYATARAVPTLPLKTGWGPGETKLEVLRAVMRWREAAAREEDESARYVLGLGGAWQLAELAPVAGRVREGRDVMQILGGAKGGVSEVVRRRKDELARLVVETVERVVGRAATDGEDVEMATAAGPSAVASAQLGLAAEEPSVRPAAGLWDTAPVASTSAAPVIVQSASSSSFYGALAPPLPSSSSLAGGLSTASSAFFGTAAPPAPAATSKASARAKGKAADRAAAVSRVHASLVLGGGLAQSLEAHRIPSASYAAEEPAVDTDVVLSAATAGEEGDVAAPTALSASADHTYVPLTARLPKPETPSLLAESKRPAPHAAPKPKDSDVVVVSSLKDKPAKKRKRSTVPAASGAEPVPAAAASTSTPQSPPPQPPQAKKLKKSGGKGSRPDPASITPHDYSSAPSILDAKPVAAAGAERRAQDKQQRKKEQRAEKVAQAGQGKGLAIDTSGFGRAPRVQNAPKKAAKSATFAK
ncbi:hypothetical protein JCM10207_004833 [Rhodosporidiobolus poonsookiae]